MRGGEKVLEVFCELFPEAKIFTLVHIKGSVSSTIEALPVETSFIQKLPGAKKRYRSYLPLFPAAIEKFDMRGFDLILSSSHCVAKGVIPHPDALHISYCFTPMRYVWSMYEEYFGKGRVGLIARGLMPLFANYLRVWDSSSAHRVDKFVADSQHVKKRIRRYYGRDADVIYPPVSTEGTYLSEKDEGYFLIVSAFAPYKRVDIAIDAFNRLGERLVVVGTGQDEKRLKKIAGRNIEFHGWVDSDKLMDYYAGCRALVFPGEEDFGIVPLEAQCFGKPVIAYGAGGVLETVNGFWVEGDPESPAENPTGLFFREQTAEALIAAVRRFASLSFDPGVIRQHALGFDREIFKDRIKAYIDRQLSGR
ncbi:glycosyltransferase [bacterium]|nr:glycosyltransferase [bacterium]